MKQLRRIVLLLVVAALGVGIWYFCKKPQSKEEYLKALTPQQALAFLEEMDVELPESYQEWDPDTLGQEAKRVIAACVEEPYNPYVFSTEDPYRFYIAIYKAVQKHLETE